MCLVESCNGENVNDKLIKQRVDRKIFFFELGGSWDVVPTTVPSR